MENNYHASDSDSQKKADSGSSPDQADRARVSHSSYRRLVKFAAVVMGVFLFLFVALDGLSSALQDAATALIKPHPQQPETHTISLNLARGLAVFSLVAVIFVFWAGRDMLRAKKALRTPEAQTQIASPDANPSQVAGKLVRTEQELARVQKQLDQQRTVLKKIQSQMYEDNVRPRHDFVSFRGLYIVGPDGDIQVEKEVILTSQELEVHFWRFYANGEHLAMPLADETEMELQVRALDDGRTECIPLLVDNKPTRKEFTVNFLPAITPGTQRAFLLKYRWPGFLRELMETGHTNYFWDSKAFTNAATADFAVEWRFDGSYGDVSCQSTRANPSGMSLEKTQRHPGTKWVYAGSGIPLGNLPLELSFSCD